MVEHHTHDAGRESVSGERAVIVDVDGVVSGVQPDPEGLPWGDEVEVGKVFGPVLISPRLRDRLDTLGRLPGVSCWWLTSWTSEIRADMKWFPGRDWPVIAEPDPGSPSFGRGGWWKLAAVERWLDAHPEIRGMAWCDDHLRGGRPAAVRRRCAVRGLSEPLLIAPSTNVGLGPADFDRLHAWALRSAHA